MEKYNEFISQSIKKSGVEVFYSIVDETVTKSCGCYITDENKIQISTKQIEQDYLELKEKGVDLLSPLHLLDIVLSHEIGHAFDEQNASRIKLCSKYYNKSLTASMKNNTFGLRKNYEMFSKIHFECELKAWEYSKKFMCLEHDSEALNTRIENSLLSYRQFYPFEYKLLHIARKLVYKLDNFLKFDISEKTNIDIKNNSKNYFNAETEILYVDIIKLLRWKHKDLKLKTDDYVFMEVLYEVASNVFSSDEADRKLGDLYTDLFGRKFQSIEEMETKLNSIYEEKKQQQENALDYMSRALSEETRCFLIFKDYKINYLKDDFEETKEFFIKSLNRQLTKKEITEQQAG